MLKWWGQAGSSLELLREPDIYVIPYMWNLKCDTDELIYDTETKSQM